MCAAAAALLHCFDCWLLHCCTAAQDMGCCAWLRWPLAQQALAGFARRRWAVRHNQERGRSAGSGWGCWRLGGAETCELGCVGCLAVDVTPSSRLHIMHPSASLWAVAATPKACCLLRLQLGLIYGAPVRSFSAKNSPSRRKSVHMASPLYTSRAQRGFVLKNPLHRVTAHAPHITRNIQVNPPAHP